MIYEYRCPRCATITERFTNDKKLDRITCPNCGGIACRTISRSNFNAYGLERSRENKGK